MPSRTAASARRKRCRRSSRRSPSASSSPWVRRTLRRRADLELHPEGLLEDVALALCGPARDRQILVRVQREPRHPVVHRDLELVHRLVARALELLGDAQHGRAALEPGEVALAGERLALAERRRALAVIPAHLPDERRLAG